MKVLIIIGIVFGSTSLIGQSYWQAGYTGGNIVHPGISLTYVQTVHQSLKLTRSGDTLHRELGMGFNAGLVYHKNYNTSATLLGQISKRRVKGNGNYFAYRIGLGYMHSWVPNTYVFERGVVKKEVTSLNYIIAEPSIEWGWSLSKSPGFIEGIYLRPKVQFSAPYFMGSNQYLMLDLGVFINTKKTAQ